MVTSPPACLSRAFFITGKNFFFKRSIIILEGVATVATLSFKDKRLVFLKRVKKFAREISVSISPKIVFQRSSKSLPDILLEQVSPPMAWDMSLVMWITSCQEE